MTDRALLTASMSEATLLRHVIEAASLLGWHVHHSRPAMLGSGRYATALSGHAGCPDLVLARGGVVRLVELKSTRGRLSDEQRGWLDASGGVVWRPIDWLSGRIEDELR